MPLARPPVLRFLLGDRPGLIFRVSGVDARALSVHAGSINLYGALPWAGGQALARYVLDHPDTVAGRRVLDLATGGGLVAIAAGRAGAARVCAYDVDPLSGAATTLNASLNRSAVTVTVADPLDGDPDEADVILAGDVFYSRQMASRVLDFLDRARRRGVDVLVGDPGRAYLPRERFAPVAVYDVPVSRALESADSKRTTVWRLAHGPR
ncbi:MAG TPA: 50S ribosomal protein L11 methyltransferase [Micromonosporaceae bacterium]